MRIFLSLTLLMLGLITFSCSSQQQLPRLRAKQTKLCVLPPVLKEASGIYYVNQDSLWLHNDSGDKAALYLVDEAGELKHTKLFPSLRHIDWESLAHDDSGNVYIGDVGNNLNHRQDLMVYRWQQPTDDVLPMGFRYEDQQAFPPVAAERHFDLEGMVHYHDSLWLFTKNRFANIDQPTKVYRLSTSKNPQVAHLQTSILLPDRVITGASYHAGNFYLLGYHLKRFLGIVPYMQSSIFVVEAQSLTPRYRIRLRKRYSQFEAIDIRPDGRIIIATESTPLMKASLWMVQPKRLQSPAF